MLEGFSYSELANTDTETNIRLRFLANFPDEEDVICIFNSFTLEIRLMDFVDGVAAIMLPLTESSYKVSIKADSNKSYNLCLIHEDREILLTQVTWGSNANPHTIARTFFSLLITGERKEVDRVVEALSGRFGDIHLSTVRWYFVSGDSNDYRSIVIDPPNAIHDEFYPMIPDGPNKYFETFLKDDSCLLFLWGPPGTGKTSLLRHFLYENKLNAMVTYDDVLLETDSLFVDFICSDKYNVLIIEDADLMLSARESDGNKLVARFLNVSDGLVKFHNKKIIFTTNLRNFDTVDPALTRPGRCFDILEFRNLTMEEGEKAAHVAGLPLPKTPVTLAELFKQTQAKLIQREIGFR